MFGRKRKWNTLRAALQQNDATATTTAAGNVKLRGKMKYYDACVTAIREGSAEALGALLKTGGGFNFSGRKYEWSPFGPFRDESKERAKNRMLALQLVKEAYDSPSPETLLPVLHAHKKNSLKEDILSARDFLTEKAPYKLLELCAKSTDLSYYEEEGWRTAFAECVYRTGLADPAKLEYILTFTDKYDPGTLAQALIAVAAGGDADKAVLLLARGANANSDNAEALGIAAKNGHREMVDFLLPHVALESHGDRIATQLRCTGGDPAIIADIVAATQKKITAMPQQDAQGYTALDSDMLEQNKALSDGARLKIVSDFRAEREMIFYTAKGASEPTMQVVGFDEMKKEIVEDKRRKLDELNSKPPSAPRARI